MILPVPIEQPRFDFHDSVVRSAAGERVFLRIVRVQEPLPAETARVLRRLPGKCRPARVDVPDFSVSVGDECDDRQANQNRDSGYGSHRVPGVGPERKAKSRRRYDQRVAEHRDGRDEQPHVAFTPAREAEETHDRRKRNECRDSRNNI